MNRAIELAKKGVGFCSPNPAVGAVIVRNGEIIAEGFHKKAGGDHAEVVAIKAVDDCEGADLYVTLEPCCHTGKTGPCTEAILEAGIKRVFVGMLDPFEKVAGRGVDFLRDNGVEVVLCDDAKPFEVINLPYLKCLASGRPFITLKVAMSLDARITMPNGESKWITCEEARTDGRLERSKCDAVLVGKNTVLADDPELAAHGNFAEKNLLRIVLGKVEDRSLKFFRDEHFLEYEGDLEGLMADLAAKGMRHLYVEGGANVHKQFVEAGLVDRVIIYIAPKFFGAGLEALGGLPLNLRDIEVEKVGKDMKIIALLS